MAHYIDLTGKRFGRWLVLGIVKLENKRNRSAWWNCRCDCGNEKPVRSQNLIQGLSKSCGCLHSETVKNMNKGKPVKILPIGEAAFNKLYDRYKRGATKRGYEFNLTKDEVKKLTSSNCYYCGQEPEQECFQPGSNGSYFYNGIDRVDNSIGYIISNCVTCCSFCNVAKGSLNMHKFLTKINLIHNNLYSEVL